MMGLPTQSPVSGTLRGRAQHAESLPPREHRSEGELQKLREFENACAGLSGTRRGRGPTLTE